MDAIARVESRIFEVQSRIARFTGGSGARPASSAPEQTLTKAGTADSSGLAARSFRDVADSLLQSGRSNLNPLLSSVGLLSGQSGVAGARGGTVLPASLTGLSNGRLPDSVLEPIGQGQHRLERSAAVAFRRMAAAAAEEGVTLQVSDSYRTVEEQSRLVGVVGLYKDGGLAAIPGTSTHGWGLSVDIETEPKALRWLRANAARFGFAEDVAREPWHYTYRPANV